MGKVIFLLRGLAWPVEIYAVDKFAIDVILSLSFVSFHMQIPIWI